MRTSGVTTEAIRIAQKSGFLTQRIWRECICPGGLRYKQKTWANLMRRNLFQRHPSSQAQETVIPNRKLAVVAPPFSQNIDHDEAVLMILLGLEKEKVIGRWRTEAELKKIRAKDFSVEQKGLSAKYPDAVMELAVPGKPVRLALEIERNQKSSTRYRENLYAYSSMNSIDGILFICASKGIEKVIRDVASNTFYPMAKRPLGFGLLTEWTKDPAQAAFALNDQPTNLTALKAKMIRRQRQNSEEFAA